MRIDLAGHHLVHIKDKMVLSIEHALREPELDLSFSLHHDLIGVRARAMFNASMRRFSDLAEAELGEVSEVGRVD